MEMEDYEFNRILDQYNIHPEITYDTTSDFALLSMVEAGLGVSIVHSLLLQPSRYHVVSKPLNVKQSREICITVKKGFLPSTITQLFLGARTFRAAAARGGRKARFPWGGPWAGWRPSCRAGWAWVQNRSRQA